MLYVPVADLEHFAALVAANEREACARVVDMNAEATTYLMLHDILQSNANAIRARGNVHKPEVLR